MFEVEERVSLLERLLADFIEVSKHSMEELKAMHKQTSIELDRVSRIQEETTIDLRLLAQSSKDAVNQLAKTMDERQVKLDETVDRLIKTMDERQAESVRGMEEFKREMRESKRELNKTLGEISKKQGTMVEDLIHPSLPRIIKESFGLHVTDCYIRRKRELPDGSKVKEYDAVAIVGQYVFVNSTKSTLRITDAEEFKNDLEEFRSYFPEYKDCKLIGILASLYVEPTVLVHLEKQGFLALGVGDELMEVKNSIGFKPKEW
ncbi:MAG: hypothetical protein SFH39_01770 [Candidatus Magnetobacterium sp. LHC-1]|nr:hypothetical protein [Nitrospirota bacterium]